MGKQNKQSTTEPTRMAICYDFDRTLTPDDMQAQGYIQQIGEKVPDFWARATELAEREHMDPNLAYLHLMLQGAADKFYVKRQSLREFGSRVQLYEGVEEFFPRINAYGQEHHMQVEHYIISSGIREMIEGTVIADYFEKIYANSFLYNEGGSAIWPAQIVNFTNKTQFLFRIEKGATDENDPRVNDYFKVEDMPIPFKYFIYIGDSQTDIPCMKLVNTYGGHSIGVYDPQKGDKSRVCQLLLDHRIRYYAPACYSEGSVLDATIKEIINALEAQSALDRRYKHCLVESRLLQESTGAALPST
ncbi:MAG: haloacid dehalogenase-like hydrolase [Succinivibrio sp.]|nr:haloacid dehalogenase-like hydrolase [Succinivibrio sp.]